jgi:hypothetical protein
MMRISTRTRKLVENKQARNFSYNIFDIDQDEKFHGGEMFLFLKFATFFK